MDQNLKTNVTVIDQLPYCLVYLKFLKKLSCPAYLNFLYQIITSPVRNSKDFKNLKAAVLPYLTCKKQFTAIWSKTAMYMLVFKIAAKLLIQSGGKASCLNYIILVLLAKHGCLLTIVTKTLQVLLLLTKFSPNGFLLIKASNKEVYYPHFCILYL